MSKYPHDNIINFYELLDEDDFDLPKAHNPNPNAPQHPFVAAIVGATSAGKTNSLLNLITTCDCFSRVYIVTEMPDEPLYAYLKRKYNEIDEKSFHITDNLNACIELNNLSKKHQSLIVFDDQAKKSEKELAVCDKVAKMCRKKNCSMIFISQSWFAIPRFTRLQCMYVIMKQVNSKRDINHLVSDLGLDLYDPEKLMKTFRKYTQGLHNFLLIDMKSPYECNRLRRNFGDFHENDHGNNPLIKTAARDDDDDDGDEK